MPAALAETLAPDVQLAAGGNVDAFARLIDATRSMVCSIALVIVRNVDDSEDVAQDVYVAAWRSLHKLRNAASFLPWLRQMTRNLAHHAARTHGRAARHRQEDADGVERALASAADPRPGPAERLVAREELLALEEAISSLPDEAREIVTLYYREGKSVRAVAELLEMSEDAVKKRLQRARERLRGELLDQAGEALRRSAPGAALTAAVVAAVTVGAPGSAAAAGIGLGGIAAGGGTFVKLVAVGSGVLGGIVGGIAGHLWGVRKNMERARTERARRDLRRLGVVGSVHIVVASVMLPLGHEWWPGPLFLAAWYIAFVGGIMWMTMDWRARIMRESVEAECREDPTATARHARERRMGILGCVAGVALSAIPIVWAMLRG